MCTCGLNRIGLDRGSQGSEQELALIIGQLLRRLSLPVHKANQTLLLERIMSELAGRCCVWDRLVEERGRWVKQGNWLDRVMGHSFFGEKRTVPDLVTDNSKPHDPTS